MAAAGIPLNVNQTDIHAIMAQSLPKHVIIQSSQTDNRYLHLYKENPVLPNALRFVGDYSFDLDTRFEVEQAKTATGLIHIRCLMNNKYWANYGTDYNWVAAMADKPEENQSDKHCTLFEPLSDDNGVLRLRHVQTGLYATSFLGGEDTYAVLALMPGPDHQGADVFTFIDWESIVVLPDRIRITASYDNGNQLKAFADGFMDFNSKADNSTLFDYDVYPSREGGIRLKSTYYGTYWTDMHPMAEGDWVKAQEADTDVHKTDTVFLPTIRSDNRVIIRCLKNNLFCNRYTGFGKTSCLATILTYPDAWSDMEIEEPVLSRRISDVRYHLTDARLYNEKITALISDDSSNKTMESMTSALNLKTTVYNTTNWSTSVSLKVGIKMTATYGVPLIESGQVEISAEVTGSMNWGETKTESQEVGSVKTIGVPTMTRVKATLMGTRLSYDIPFSYTQYDVLTDGSTKPYEKNDGIFTANNGYGYRYEVVNLPLE